MPRVLEDVACTLCGCVCDDLRVTVEGGRIIKAEKACDMAEPWLLGQQSTTASPFQIEGKPVSLVEARQRAAEILAHAKAPLIYGLSQSSTPGQRAAVRLADQLGATIDTTASLCHAPSIMAIQQVGESTCSLGEVKNRADVVMYWGSDPQVSHPRHLQRYAIEPAGKFIPRGREDRQLIVVDTRPTATSELADRFIQVEQDADFELIWSLRWRLRGGELPSAANCGFDPAIIDPLLETLKNCRCGVVFFGLGLAGGEAGHRNVEALLRLVADLNAHTRFHAKRMRVWGDVAGADSVLCWQTGYPFSVNLARGYPRYNPGEYSADTVLARGEADACLLMGSEAAEKLCEGARRHLETIPTIVLDPPGAAPIFSPAVSITTGVYGIHFPGTAYRMDEVPIPLRTVLPGEFPSDAEVLKGIANLVRKGAAGQ